MIELKDDLLVFSFPDVHPEAKLRMEFQRTLRIPDDDKTYPLPPGLGRFPLRHVDDHATRIPGGCNRERNRESAYSHAPSHCIWEANEGSALTAITAAFRFFRRTAEKSAPPFVSKEIPSVCLFLAVFLPPHVREADVSFWDTADSVTKVRVIAHQT